MNMTTTFVDTVTGEEYEFLGTSIQFSEKELIALEKQHDDEIDSYVQQLIENGYFDQEWEDEEAAPNEIEIETAKINAREIQVDEEESSSTECVSCTDNESDSETSESEEDEIEPRVRKALPLYGYHNEGNKENAECVMQSQFNVTIYSQTKNGPLRSSQSSKRLSLRCIAGNIHAMRINYGLTINIVN